MFNIIKFFNSSTARFPELKVDVVIRNLTLLISVFSFPTKGKILLNSPILAAWNQINLDLSFFYIEMCR